MSYGVDISRAESLKEAFQLQSLSTNSTATLLEYCLKMGFVEKRLDDDRILMKSLNVYPMSESRLVGSLAIEILARLGILIPATGLVKLAIDDSSRSSVAQDKEYEKTRYLIYILSILLHQFINFDKVSVRTINRLLMCLAIILFSLSSTNSPPCDDMKQFKTRIRRRLQTDYYFWTLLLAMNFVLTWTSPMHINPEFAYVTEMHLFHQLWTCLCCVQMCLNMKLIGNGRLNPIIVGTPLMFLDIGDEISIIKCSSLVLCYIMFWCLDWRELVDWNHPMLCEAGICKLLKTERGNFSHLAGRARQKFELWLMEEGIDDEGWFILLDPPIAARGAGANSTVFRPQSNHESSSGQADHRLDGDDYIQPTTTTTTTNISQTGPNINQDNISSTTSDESSMNQETRDEDGGHNTDEATDDGQDDGDDLYGIGQPLVDMNDRVIYLQSRNPLLTSLAALMLLVWK